MLRIPRARASWIAGNCSGPAPTTNKLGIRLVLSRRGSWCNYISTGRNEHRANMARELEEFVGQHGKQETVDEAAVRKRRRT